ncbi:MULTISPECIES: hypothetical protein [Halorussus]|uniref:hypothetical protein n=1 Tax=Halorussus TaxID=1070314 RepID=UPI00209F1721|nr:hypothetical protein [Halorussus vallis]USZ75646.1 hypothetical protein NGM07_19735 [Halorussus vallis]USZ75700.1 hypothetical protein NGM07_20010 [Halorussus vallis]
MKGQDAICPESGARLSEDRHPDERRRPYRAPEDESGLLTTGEHCSSRGALITFFRRTHRGMHDGDLDRNLLRRAALHLYQLKRASDARDEWIWYALCERLHRDGYDVAWMRAVVDPVCPHCGSELTAELAPRDEVLPKCGASCRGDQFLAGDIANAIRRTFNQAFDKHVERGHLKIA